MIDISSIELKQSTGPDKTDKLVSNFAIFPIDPNFPSKLMLFTMQCIFGLISPYHR